MEALPHEVLCNIVSFLPKTVDDGGHDASHPGSQRRVLVRPKLATISRAWQFAIEAITFRELHTKSHQPELEIFKVAFSDSQLCRHRRPFLRNLQYDVVLPDYDTHACTEYETDEDRRANNVVFTKGVSELLQTLSQWPADCNLTLYLDAYSPSDYAVQSNEIRHERDRLHGDLMGNRYLYSYLSLQSPLPLVSCVRSLGGPYMTRPVHPATSLTIRSKFPNLRYVSFAYAEPDQFLPLRRRLLNDLTASLQTFELSPETKNMDWAIAAPMPRHDHRLPNFTASGSLYANIRSVIANSKLEVLLYKGIVDAALFWGPAADLAEPWASVRVVDIEFDLASPSGRWYFKGKAGDSYNKPESDEPLPLSTQGHFPPGYGSAEQTAAALAFQRTLGPDLDHDGLGDARDDFRQVPNDDVMLPLLEAVARRLAVMPSLETWYMAVFLPQTRSEWFLAYSAAGRATGFESSMDEVVFDKDSSEAVRTEVYFRPRVLLHVGDWRPSRQVLDLLAKAGAATSSKDAVVGFLPFLY